MLRVEDDDEDRAAGLQRLAGDLLFWWHHAFRATEVHVDDAGLDPVHDPAGELAPMLGDVAQDFVALEIVDVPQHRVLCSLGGHAFEVFRGKLGDDGGPVRTDDSASHVERPGLSIEFDRHLARRVEGARVGREGQPHAELVDARGRQLVVVERGCEYEVDVRLAGGLGALGF